MQRELIFEGNRAAKRFEFCLTAVLSGGNGKEERSRIILRKEARLLDAFDSISTEIVNQENSIAGQGTATRVLSGLSNTVILQQEDFDLLIHYVDITPWVSRVAREAVDVMDWLSAARKIE